MTAAALNAEIRDHCTFLKGALDLITNSTAADTGSTCYLSINRTTSADVVIQGNVAGDAAARIVVRASGTMEWGNGTNARDTFLARADVGVLRSSSAISSMRTNSWDLAFHTGAIGDTYGRWFTTCAGTFGWSNGTDGADVSLWRPSANILRTDGTFSAIGLQINGVDAVGARIGGWATPAGTSTRGAWDTSTVVLESLAQRVKALIDDLKTHGLIGS